MKSPLTEGSFVQPFAEIANNDKIKMGGRKNRCHVEGSEAIFNCSYSFATE